MFSASFAVIGCHGQHSEFPAGPFFAGRPSQTAAALAVSCLKLACWSNNGVAAVAEALPEHLPCFGTLRCHPLDKQFSKAFSGQILTQIPDDTQLILYGETDGWFVTNYDGKTGYVSGEFLKL